MKPSLRPDLHKLSGMIASFDQPWNIFLQVETALSDEKFSSPHPWHSEKPANPCSFLSSLPLTLFSLHRLTVSPLLLFSVSPFSVSPFSLPPFTVSYLQNSLISSHSGLFSLSSASRIFASLWASCCGIYFLFTFFFLYLIVSSI